MKQSPFFRHFALLVLLCTLPFCFSACAEDEGCDHTMIRETVVAPTCDKEGKTVHQCADCPFVYTTDPVPPLGHTFSLETTAPTCDKEGYTDYTCACGYSFRSDYKLPLGHTYKTAITAPTCTAAGFTVYTCDCGRSYTGDHVEPTGHTYQTETKDASCTEAGYTVYSCDCGHSHRSDLIAPLGHTFKSAVTLPTMSSMGYTDFTCDCGFSYTGDFRSYQDILKDAYAYNDQVLAKGIDVSKWNHKVDAKGNYVPLDWSAIKAAGIDYVILKAGSTKTGVEPTFEMDYKGAKEAGLDVGAYFYTYSSTVSGTKADVSLLLTALEGKQFEYPIYFDLEDPSLENLLPGQLTELCVTFCSALQAEGYYAGIYINLNWLKYKLETERTLQLFEIWYAHWTYADLPVWSETTTVDTLGMWQYTDKGSFEFLEGIPFDLNFAYKDYPTLIKGLGLNGFQSS